MPKIEISVPQYLMVTEHISFSPFQPGEQSFGQSVSRSSGWDCYCPTMDNPIVVPQTPENADSEPFDSSSQCDILALQGGVPSSSQEVATIGLSGLGEPFGRKGVSPKATKLLLASWRDSTKTQYESYIKRWLAYCVRRKIDPH